MSYRFCSEVSDYGKSFFVKNKTNPLEKQSIFDSIFNKHIEKLIAHIKLYEYCNIGFINKQIEKNGKIQDILDEYELKVEINISNIETITDVHLNPTVDIALKIAQKLDNIYKFTSLDKKNLVRGAIFHDFGKVLIPEKILNKKEKLTEHEKEIIHLHPVLGFELLKNSDLNKQVLEIILKHHKYINNVGYPSKVKDPDILVQIVTIADIFSALISKRTYKKEFSQHKALEIIEKQTQKGDLHPILYESLIKIFK